MIGQLTVPNEEVIKRFKRQKTFALLESEKAIGWMFQSSFQFQTFYKQELCDPLG